MCSWMTHPAVSSCHTVESTVSEVPFLNGTTSRKNTVDRDELRTLIAPLRHKLRAVDIGLIPLLCDKPYLTVSSATSCVHCNTVLNYRNLVPHLLSGDHLEKVLAKHRPFTHWDVSEMSSTLDAIQSPSPKFYEEKLTERPVSHLVLPFWRGHKQLDEDDKLNNTLLVNELEKLRYMFENLKKYVKKVLVARELIDVADVSVQCMACHSAEVNGKITGVYKIFKHSLGVEHIDKVLLKGRLFSKSRDLNVMVEILDAADALHAVSTHKKAAKAENHSKKTNENPTAKEDIVETVVKKVSALSTKVKCQSVDDDDDADIVFESPDAVPLPSWFLPRNANRAPQNRVSSSSWRDHKKRPSGHSVSEPPGWRISDHLVLAKGDGPFEMSLFSKSRHLSDSKPLTLGQLVHIYRNVQLMIPSDLSNHCKKLEGLQYACPLWCELCEKIPKCACSFIKHLFCRGHQEAVISEDLNVTLMDVTTWVELILNSCREPETVLPRWSVENCTRGFSGLPMKQPEKKEERQNDALEVPKAAAGSSAVPPHCGRSRIRKKRAEGATEICRRSRIFEQTAANRRAAGEPANSVQPKPTPMRNASVDAKAVLPPVDAKKTKNPNPKMI